MDVCPICGVSVTTLETKRKLPSTCFVNVLFKAHFQALYQLRDALPVFFNNAQFGLQFQVIGLLDVLPEGPDTILFVGKAANQRIPDA